MFEGRGGLKGAVVRGGRLGAGAWRCGPAGGAALSRAGRRRGKGAESRRCLRNVDRLEVSVLASLDALPPALYARSGDLLLAQRDLRPPEIAKVRPAWPGAGRGPGR